MRARVNKGAKEQGKGYKGSRKTGSSASKRSSEYGEPGQEWEVMKGAKAGGGALDCLAGQCSLPVLSCLYMQAHSTKGGSDENSR